MDESYLIVNKLFDKYKSNTYMKNKLENYIKNLPIILSNIESEYDKRLINKEILNKNKETFISEFLEENHFLYIPQTELFIYYNNISYNTISEDDILHLIIDTINKNKPNLQQCKFKIKTSIIKQIKETSICSSIPESITIQNILNFFYPNIFKTKNQIKYFLTIIGDNILNKKDNLVYLVDTSFKPLIQLISQQLFLYFNKNTTDNFKYKYSEHKFEYCRILQINNKNFDSNFIKHNIINIISVSCYYSKRYTSSEKFIEQCNDIELKNSVLILKDNPCQNLVNKFLNEYTVISDSNMQFKDLYFIWKQFLKKYNLPNVINANNFKSFLSQSNIYDIENDTCNKIKSKYNSEWTHFQQFWSTNIVYSEDEDNNYEISELITLFHDWCKSKSISTTMVEEDFTEIMLWNNPNLHMEDNKHVYNITCKLWDKTTTIDLALHSMKEQNKNLNILNAYKFYCKFINTNYKGKYIVSKLYFDKYINTYSETI